MIIIIMGVSGSGKSTVGKALAARLRWHFADADDFHPQVNIEKMSQGIPLTDTDRLPWLLTLREQCDRWRDTQASAVLACSALKESYRDTLGCTEPDVALVYLRGSYEQIQQRLAARSDHFMPPELLASQFAALEEPQDAITIEIDQPLNQLIEAILKAIPSHWPSHNALEEQ